MRFKLTLTAVATLALSLAAVTSMATTERFARTAYAEAAGRDALAMQVFGGASNPDCQLAQK